MAGYPGTDPAVARELIQRHHVGGIILFTRNIRNAEHAAEVCEALRKYRREVSDSPLFIALDQEGGCVARLTEGVTVFAGAMALGASNSEHYAREAGATTGAELSALGVNVNFAPVLDISSNPRNPGVGARSFGRDPESVARLGAATIKGLQDSGILATAKHFPGLGEARVDSHDELPTIDSSRKQLEDSELLPFRAAIEADVGVMMTAHCSYPALDKTRTPCTLSRPMLNDLLREQMGFNGLVITDCLEMAGVEKGFPASRSVPIAVRAGADMLLICHTVEKQMAAFDSLACAVDKGEVSGEAIDKALGWISSIKGRLDLPKEFSADGFDLRTSLSRSIAEEAITIVKNNDSVLPLKLSPSESLALILPSFGALTKVEENAEPHEVLLRELKARHQRLLYQQISVNPTDDETRDSTDACKKADKLLILTYNLHLYPSQKELVNSLLKIGKPSIVVAVRDPYDLAFTSTASACVATYGFRECSLTALVRALFGEIEAKGKLPVELA